MLLLHNFNKSNKRLKVDYLIIFHSKFFSITFIMVKKNNKGVMIWEIKFSLIFKTYKRSSNYTNILYISELKTSSLVQKQLLLKPNSENDSFRKSFSVWCHRAAKEKDPRPLLHHCLFSPPPLIHACHTVVNTRQNY